MSQALAPRDADPPTGGAEPVSEPTPADAPVDNERGLADPRAIHPGPEGEWPFPARTTTPDTASEDAIEDAADRRTPDISEERGLVDPRPEAAAPEMFR